MSHRKKKSNTYQNQKLARAQHKNDFYRKLKSVIKAVCGENIYSLIPQTLLEKLYIGRCHSVKFAAANGHNIPYEIIDDAKVILAACIKRDKIAITTAGHVIPLDDFFTIGLTLINLCNSLKNDDFPNATKLKTALQPFTANDNKVLEVAIDKLNNIILTAGYTNSDIGKSLYWYKHELKYNPEISEGIQNLVEIYSHVPESITFKIDGIARPALRMVWAFAFSGLEWVSIKPSSLNIQNSFADIPLDVYIQSHALQRLAERIDCFITGLIHLNVYVSLRNPKVFYDTNNNMLIEFRFFDTKAGYFRVDIIDGRIIIRTFLFVTNNGTPEGQKLEQNTGLQKLDKKYLAIDKLSTFMSSDIGNNTEVRKIFEHAGCRCLIDLYEKTKVLCTKTPDQQTSGLILDYLRYADARLTETL